MFRSVRARGTGQGVTAEVNIAPLMDMVFILLIFFIVTSTFAKDTGVRVDRPSAASAGALAPDALRVAITASGAVYVDGSAVDLAALRGRVADFLAQRPGGQVVLVPDQATPAGRLVQAMDAAKLAGARDLAVATRKAERP